MPSSLFLLPRKVTAAQAKSIIMTFTCVLYKGIDGTGLGASRSGVK